MAHIIISNIDRLVRDRLCSRAARNGRSLEEEARAILHEATANELVTGDDLVDAIAARFKRFGGVDLALPAR